MGRIDERAALRESVLDGPLDAHARAVASLLHCDGALVTIVDDEHQHFVGLAAPPDRADVPRSTPLEWSICQHVVETAAPLVVTDLATDATLSRSGAHTILGVDAYVGVPLASPSGDIVGAVCGVNFTPRSWSDEDVERLVDVRDLVEAEIAPLLRREQQAARADEVSLLLSTLRHELGGELAVVLGGLETALLPGLDQELRDKVLVNARRDCRRVIATLDALLRMDSRAPIQLREVELASLVGEVMETIASTRGDDRVVTEVGDACLVTEPTLLAHVLRNLLDNAHKYTEGRIVVRGGPTDRGIRLSVSDSGRGMPTEVVDQLYEPFSRRRDDGGRSGFGLGLYIIRTLCRRLQATLDVDTGEHGTTITVDVPDRAQSPKPSKAASSSDGA